MILTPHIFAGAALAVILPRQGGVILLALILHFLMDAIPHLEYLDASLSIKKTIPRITLDLFGGLLFVYFLAGFSWWSLMVIFFSLLPDGFILFYALFRENRFLQAYFNFNHRLHFILLNANAQKKMWIGWKILSQIAVIVISILIILI